MHICVLVSNPEINLSKIVIPKVHAAKLWLKVRGKGIALIRRRKKTRMKNIKV